MMKTFLTGAFFCLFALSALAQNSNATNSTCQVTPDSTASAGPAKGIGPAPANTPQHHILSTALSSQTRQTLQEAMNSARASNSAPAHPAPPAK